MKGSISGKWSGVYIYGAGYEEDLRGKRVRFTVELFEDEQLVRGSCIDAETEHILTGKSKIEGTFENGLLVFYKTYPFTFDFAENDVAYIVEHVSSPSIQYTGLLRRSLFSRSHYFKGDWEIHGSYLDDNGCAQYYSSHGTWRMERG